MGVRWDGGVNFDNISLQTSLSLSCLAVWNVLLVGALEQLYGLAHVKHDWNDCCWPQDAKDGKRASESTTDARGRFLKIARDFFFAGGAGMTSPTALLGQNVQGAKPCPKQLWDVEK